MSGKGRRNDSSSDNVPVSDIESIVKPIVQKAIEAATEVIRKEFMKVLNERMIQLEDTVNKLSTDYMKISDLETRIRTLENDATRYQQSSPTSVDTLRQEIADTKRWANDNEQYSRRYNIRINGLSLSNDSDIYQEAVSLFRNKLNIQNINVADIDAAHRVTSHRSTASAGEASSQPRSQSIVLVRFRERQHRDLVMRHRRMLKGSRITIAEDLTAANVQTLHRTRNSSLVSKCWSWNGKIHAILQYGKHVIVKPFQLLGDAEEVQ